MYAVYQCRYYSTSDKLEMVPVLRSLLKLGADPNQPTTDVGESHDIPATLPLHSAVCAHELQIIFVLLEYGADVYKKDTSGLDALAWATHQERQARNRNTSQQNIQAQERHANSLRVFAFIKDVYEAKRVFENVKHDLHKELAEYVFHPARLCARGYFNYTKSAATTASGCIPEAPGDRR